jgi:alanine racemase
MKLISPMLRKFGVINQRSRMMFSSFVKDSKQKRWAWAEIDLGALKHNIRILAAKAHGQDVFAVVKADAYGHGSVECAQAALDAGASGLCVAVAHEGLELRAAGIQAPILVFSEQPPELHAHMLMGKLTATLYNKDTIDAYGKAATDLGLSSAPVHLKLNSGMNRVGCTPTDAVDRALQIYDHPALNLEGFFSHMACADGDGEHSSVAKQAKAFADAYDSFGFLGLTKTLSVVHLANSAATVRAVNVAVGGDVCTAVRVGIAMYGIHGDAASNSFGQEGDVALEQPLEPVMSLKARVSHVQRLKAGQCISYGLRKPLTKDSTIATLPLGYADGVIRSMWDEGHVLIGGKRRPFAGMITMDQVMVDMGDDDVHIGDEAVLIGRQGNEVILSNDWARMANTIGYEVTCGITARIPRIYVEASSV